MKKFMSAVLTLLVIVTMLQSVVLAANGGITDDAQKIQEKAAKVLNVIAWFGYAISLGMLMYVGAKYTMASANEKADVKRGLTAYVFGVFLIGGASLIADIVSSIATNGSSQGAAGMASSLIDVGQSLGGMQ